MTTDSHNTVLIVHAIDTEGPLYESLEAKFERLEEVYSITGIARTQENLEKIKSQKLDLGGREADAAQMLSAHRNNYNDSWEKIDAMLDRIMAREFRMQQADSFGGGWVYNWHCLDHVGYEANPRRRDLGYHKVFDHYQRVLAA